MLIEQPKKPDISSQLERPIMTLSAYSVQGKRSHMEDFFDIGFQMKPLDQQRPNEWPYEYFYLGIFDGHGGREAANFAKENLLKFIIEEKDFWSQKDDDVIRAIRTGFARTHSAMKKVMPTWFRSNRVLPSTAGTTASILFIKNAKFYTGHVGDSRIVISQENVETKQWISQQITDDHKPESKKESERIQRAGGEVRNKIGVHRVVWKRPVLDVGIENHLFFRFLDDFPDDPKDQEYEDSRDEVKVIPSYPVPESLVESYQTIPFLAIARSLGDFWSINPYSGQYIVSPEPDVSCRPIQPNDSCILLATDGLWNIMNSSYAVRILQELNILKTKKNRKDHIEYFAIDNFYDVAGSSENHAQSLVYIAYQMWERKRLRSDNITVVVAMLHDILGHFQQTNKPYVTRASMNSSKILDASREIPKADPIQIEHTNCYFERIFSNSRPTLNVILPEIFAQRWECLRNNLLLPPSFLMTRQIYNCIRLESPLNYTRLSRAKCSKILQPNKPGKFYIYIKRVTDDPADTKLMPTRTGKSGKEVRDASAQATQPMHDFGLPWDYDDVDRMLNELLLDEEEEEYLNKCERSYQASLRRSGGEEIIAIRTSPNRKDELEEGEENDDVEGTDEPDEDEVNENSDEEKPAPKLRERLLNHSPPPRRTTRSSYQSASENAKRKLQANLSPVPKAKRRRSQPIPCAVK